MEHKRRSIRLKGYDYSSAGYYYVTICAFKRFLIFGRIFDKRMLLNKVGLVVKEELLKTVQMRKNVIIDDFAIMPNHVHLVLIIRNVNDVGAYCNTPLQVGNLVSPKNNLGSIIRGIKSVTSKRIQEIKDDGFPVWQRNYYERIIRNETEYLKIMKYIRLNPLMWERDRNNPRPI